ncbi:MULTISPECIES: tellurite resistance TerB family protein [unclassified Deinococcus]|uniref:tellurite resistance TerB family protein n=1 Tax=unclassified Deinococcus TaxID=2623546 RepID=UPI0006DD2656|nr:MULTISPECIES: TerB family tellurite resistance protein [unclassified Deinococcus]MBX8465227.1 TerB family tellurite resistance protein [Deinococcus sp. RIT780]MCD0159423.1 tellurite resistance TerB family protein [Deinococcus sp. 6GRE01]MCD0161361.1 tellurite resistance TerB family protein [Deinococcus sp. 6YEL10]MCD0167811.1 tellurite resistance TerB family protein [Deinococcus sp. 12RED42]MCD0168573.1 tellurite resistance TerB family protein [Deinococcus sp. 23YEL01]
MGFLKNLKDRAQQGLDAAQKGWGQYNNAKFADAAMAASALISAADGRIDPEERRKTAAFIMSSDKLKAFDVSVLAAKYDAHCDTMTRDPDFGKINLLQAVGKVAKDAVEARTVAQVALLIATADGNFDESEQKMARDIIHALKLQPGEFGL